MTFNFSEFTKLAQEFESHLISLLELLQKREQYIKDFCNEKLSPRKRIQAWKNFQIVQREIERRKKKQSICKLP